MHSLAELCSELSQIKTAIVVTHVSPDADAIGSSCALQLGLSAAGKSAVVYMEDAIPEYVNPLAKSASIVCRIPEQPVDAVIAVDTASFKRISGNGEELKKRAKKVFNLDHHASNDEWGDVNYIEADAPSASAIVLKALLELKWKITPDMANLMFAGLLDDTGSFRFSNVTAAGFASAGKLVELGAKPDHVATCLYYSLPERVLRLRSEALSTLQMFAEGKIAFVAVTKAMVERCSAKPEDAEGIIDFARSVRGTEAAVLLRELDDGWKASLRSKSEKLDVNAVAATFGGGGHRAAAGCKVQGTLEQARAAIVEALTKGLK